MSQPKLDAKTNTCCKPELHRKKFVQHPSKHFIKPNQSVECLARIAGRMPSKAVRPLQKASTSLSKGDAIRELKLSDLRGRWLREVRNQVRSGDEGCTSNTLKLSSLLQTCSRVLATADSQTLPTDSSSRDLEAHKPKSPLWDGLSVVAEEERALPARIQNAECLECCCTVCQTSKFSTTSHGGFPHASNRREGVCLMTLLTI